jgi:hypothetical protein
MEYSVEEVPAASWAPSLEPALACYRIVHEVAGTLLETPDASETDERNAHEVVAMLNGVGLLRRALEEALELATPCRAATPEAWEQRQKMAREWEEKARRALAATDHT